MDTVKGFFYIFYFRASKWVTECWQCKVYQPITTNLILSAGCVRNSRIRNEQQLQNELSYINKLKVQWTKSELCVFLLI